ncbi:hypothetical protein J4206_07735 [Candidatus Woesearchaeota archaeon]|nr:hypothetical protein [Candidatus Woesearchaeota archaeon]
MKFCVKCGKRTEELKESLCRDCSDLLHEIKIKDLSSDICTSCHKYSLHHQMLPYHKLEDALKEIINDSLKKEEVQLKITIPQHKVNPGIEFQATANITSHGNEYEVPIDILYTICDKCSKQGTKYFEGTLQLRTTDEEVIRFVNAELKDAKKKESVFITKKVEEKNGFDYYLTSQRYLQKLGKKLKTKFDGEIKVTTRLFSRDRQRSKDLHRVTVFFKTKELIEKRIVSDTEDLNQIEENKEEEE